MTGPRKKLTTTWVSAAPCIFPYRSNRELTVGIWLDKGNVRITPGRGCHEVLKTVTTSVFRRNNYRQMCEFCFPRLDLISSLYSAKWRSLFWYLMSAFPWGKLSITTGPSSLFQGRTEVLRPLIYAQWNLKKARAPKRWPLTHGPQQWQTKERG